MFNILDILFPRSNRDFSSISTYLTVPEIESQIPKLKPLTKKQKTVLEGIFVASKYDNYLMVDLMNRLKFNHETAIIHSFYELINYKIFTQCEYFIPDPDGVIPVPSDPTRYVERGYSIPNIISKKISKNISKPCLNILEKKFSTPKQSRLDRKERLDNIKNSIAIVNKPPNLSNYEIVWLVDDIVTTGTTLYECAKIIKKEYPFIKIYGITVSGN